MTKPAGKSKSIIKLPPIGEHAGVSVVSPASFANDQRVESGMERLRLLGFDPRLGAATQTRGPLYFAGTPEARLADLHAAFTDEQTRIVAAVRGGYGSNYLLGKLDLEVIRKHPKPFFGYSDLTGVQLHLLDQLGLPAFHGPMVAADFANRRRRTFTELSRRMRRRALYAGRGGRIARAEAGKRARHALWRMPEHCGGDAGHARGSRRPRASCCSSKISRRSRSRWIACCGNCAMRASLTACVGLFSARCWIALRPARHRVCWKM